MGRVDVQLDIKAIALEVAEWLTQRATATLGRFGVCLSGGSTPETLYKTLASPPFRARFPWKKAHFFFGDERLVPHDHPDSNFRMASSAMLEHVPVPRSQIYPFRTDISPADSALRYAETLKQYYGAEALQPDRPLFDVTFLGLGEDGHTASLFPGVPALNERVAWTAAVIGAKPEPRLTLTLPALNSSHAVAFLVAGAAKRNILTRALAGSMEIPATHVRPQGELFWFTDLAATT